MSVGESLFDERFGLADVKPKRLSRMVGFPQRCPGGRLLPRRPEYPVLRQHHRHQHPRPARYRRKPAGLAAGALETGRQRTAPEPRRNRRRAGTERAQLHWFSRRFGQPRPNDAQGHGAASAWVRPAAMNRPGRPTAAIRRCGSSATSSNAGTARRCRNRKAFSAETRPLAHRMGGAPRIRKSPDYGKRRPARQS